MSNLPNVLGLELEQAKRRLHQADAEVIVVYCSSKKGVIAADSVRVIRQRMLSPETGKITVELLISAFKTNLTTICSQLGE